MLVRRGRYSGHDDPEFVYARELAASAGVWPPCWLRTTARKRSTAFTVACTRTEENTSKACCAPGTSAYTTGWSDALRSSSTNVRACSTGTSESFAPWMTKKGGACAPTWLIGEACPQCSRSVV